MKKLLLILTILGLPYLVSGQKRNRVLESGLPLDTPANKVRFREIIEIKKSKSELYAAVLKYFNHRHSVEGEDKETGNIYGRAAFYGDSYGITNIDYRFKFEIAVREGKYRYTFSNINLDNKGGAIESVLNITMIGRTKFQDAIKDDFNIYIDAMKRAINKELSDTF